jgi:hypothetical protein
MGFKIGVWQQLSEKNLWRGNQADCYKILRGVQPTWNNKNVLNIENKSFLMDFKTYFTLILQYFVSDRPSLLSAAVEYVEWICTYTENMRNAWKLGYLSEFESKIENILGNLSGTTMGLFGQTTLKAACHVCF